MSAEALIKDLDMLKAKRKEGEITVLEFYRELLRVAIKMAEEMKLEDISEEDAKRQIPLVLAFIEDQLKKFKDRGG